MVQYKEVHKYDRISLPIINIAESVVYKNIDYIRGMLIVPLEHLLCFENLLRKVSNGWSWVHVSKV